MGASSSRCEVRSSAARSRRQNLLTCMASQTQATRWIRVLRRPLRPSCGTRAGVSTISSCSPPHTSVSAGAQLAVVVLTHRCRSETPTELSPQALARRLDAGANLLLITSPESAEIWRDFAREFGVDFDDRGSFAVDHFSYATEDDDGTHTLLAIPPASAPLPFVSAATRAGPPIAYRGAAHSTSRNPLLTTVLHASSTTFGATLDGVVSSDDDKLAGSATSLVSSFQARNNARVSFVGSFDLFSDRYFAEGASTRFVPSRSCGVGCADDHEPANRFGNAAFARDLVDWTFQKTGLLVKRSSQVVVPGDQTSRSSYQVGTQLVRFRSQSDGFRQTVTVAAFHRSTPSRWPLPSRTSRTTCSWNSACSTRTSAPGCLRPRSTSPATSQGTAPSSRSLTATAFSPSEWIIDDLGGPASWMKSSCR